MKIKVSEATNLQLDWMVAKAEGRLGKWLDLGQGTSAEDVVLIGRTLSVYQGGRPDYTYYAPSTDWSQGGPIIEQKGISVMRVYKDWPHPWCAELGEQNFTNAQTPLVAAMRCFVASKLGDEVEVPEKLT